MSKIKTESSVGAWKAKDPLLLEQWPVEIFQALAGIR